jgi:hypothetical protein
MADNPCPSAVTTASVCCSNSRTEMQPSFSSRQDPQGPLDERKDLPLLVDIPSWQVMALSHSMIKQRAPASLMGDREAQIRPRQANHRRDGRRHVRRLAAALRASSGGQFGFHHGKRAAVHGKHEFVEIGDGIVDRTHRATGLGGQFAGFHADEAVCVDAALGRGNERFLEIVSAFGGFHVPR